MAAAGSSRRASRGVTLIELAVVVTLIAVIGAIAVPGLQSFVSGQRVKALANDLASDLATARSEALKRNVAVSMSPNGGDWSAGWVVTAAGTTVLSRPAIGEGLGLDGAPSGITFNVHGRVSAPAGVVRLTVYSNRLPADTGRRCVELDLSGRARARTGACA